MGTLMISDNQEHNHNYSNLVSKTETNSFNEISIFQETLFLLDWDDTLLCTSFITLKKFKLSKEESKLIEQLGKSVSEFLIKCLKKGSVIIMTNSNEAWVKLTATKLMKMDSNLFNEITIISTRDVYQKLRIAKKQWKKIAFKELIKNHDNKIKNLICVSDMPEDIEIFKNITEKYNDIKVATVKFRISPSPKLMLKEIKIMKDNLDNVVGSNKRYFLCKEKDEDELFSFQNWFNIFRF